MQYILGRELVKGGWCKIYALEGYPDLCAKLLIPRRRHKGEQPEPDVIVQNKYKISDFLQYEWENYQKICAACPEDLQQYFVKIHGVFFTVNKQKILVMDIVHDESGAIAPSLQKTKKKISKKFLHTLERIRKEVFLENAVDHFGIVPRNILVKNTDFPVFIDFQTGKERFRGQFWLRYKFFVRKKINRCFKKLYNEIMQKDIYPVDKV